MAAQLSQPTPNFSHRLSSNPLGLTTSLPSSSTTTYPQTFLLSPSSTAISFRIDSPVLPHSPSETTHRASVIEIGSPNNPHQTTFLYTPSESVYHSPLSRWASSPTVVDGPSPLLTTYRVSDVLAHNTDSAAEAEDEDYIAGWSIVPPTHASQLSEDTEPLVRAAELELPHIGEEDFPYYPEAAELGYAGEVEEKEGKESRKLKRVRRRLCKKVGEKEFSLRGLIKKGLLKMKLRRWA